MDAANIRTIRIKLRRGEELSTNDLRSLEPLHDAVYDDDGCVRVVPAPGVGVGVSDGVSDGDDHDEQEQVLTTMERELEFNLVDYLDRSLLQGRQECEQEGSPERLPRLVRYVGKFNDLFPIA